MRGQTSCNRYSVGPPAAGPPATQSPATQSPAAQPPATQSPATQSPAAQPSRQQVGRQQWEELVRAGLPSRSPTVHFFNGWMLSQMACSIWSVCRPCSENSVMSLCCREWVRCFLPRDTTKLNAKKVERKANVRILEYLGGSCYNNLKNLVNAVGFIDLCYWN